MSRRKRQFDELVKLPPQTEAHWMGQVLQLARMFGWAWWHDQAVNQAPTCGRRRAGVRCGGQLVCATCGQPFRPIRNAEGWPDLFLLRDDVLIVPELKTDVGKVTPAQQSYQDAFARVRRLLVAVWRPRDIDEVTRTLR